MYTHLSREDGAVAVIVAVFVAFVGVGLLVIALDGGSLLQSRRALVIDTDAAAHAGAIALANDWRERESCEEDVAETEARRLLESNDPAGENEVIDVAAGCNEDAFTGWVRMTAQQSSPGFVSGRDDLVAGGTTTVEFDLSVSDFEDGMAICGDLFVGSNQSEFTLNDGRLAIPYHKAVQTIFALTSTACGVEDQWLPEGGPAPSTPGGWGWLSGVCEAVGGFWCDVSTGNDISQLGGARGETIRFPIFDAWDGDPGTNADLRIVGYLRATVENVCNLPGGGNNPADPQDCNNSNRIGTNFNGQPEFVIVADARPFFFDEEEVAMFDEASFSICDVGAGTGFCP